MTDTIRWARGDDGIVILTLDDPRQSANTMNDAYKYSMGAVIDRLEAERDAITGVIITSAKKTFFAGGDLHELKAVTREQAAELSAGAREVKAQLRRLETFGRPVVAAINGAALGGGLEICLACHYRIVLDAPGVQVGLPEVTLGLLPGGGGVVRSVRLLGVVKALTEVLLPGTRHRPTAAKELGIVDELVSTLDQLIPAAKAWIQSHPDANVQPWDASGYEIPGGTPSSPGLARTLPSLPANLRRQLKGANYPAPHHILAAAVEGAQVDIENAFEIEGRYFADLATGQVAKNMIQAFFFDSQAVSGARGRPADAEVFRPGKVLVLGAGMMGAGIAFVCAKAGLEVVLKDVTSAAADRGKAYSEKLMAKAVEKGAASRDEAAALLSRIRPTADAADAAGATLVIEAVFEDPALKTAVFAEIEPYVSKDALVASNTSTLPITALGKGVWCPENFIGLHFFSPVDKMPLLEIIRGERSSDHTLFRALDVARLIKKTPIVVNDARGFFTSRVIGTFINEAIGMLREGVPAPSIEQASSQAGYPAPVLQLSDELNLTLMRRIRRENQSAAEAAGRQWTSHPADEVIDRMVDEFDRPGRLAGAGFYEYRDGRRAGLWPGLRAQYGGANLDIPFDDLKERLLFIEALESIKCLDELVLESVADANVGSILGIGYPGWTGGVLQYVNGYEGGPAGFVARSRELAERYGERFVPPATLVEKAGRGEIYGGERVLASA
jgi:3-hydroxyacyl-CoA dehydrogenase/enoyl-CoA hydratase/3-hydroxybutyryl-CoA epimerase